MNNQTGSVSGRVTTAQGEPVAGAAAMIESGPTHVDMAALTDAQGEFRYDDLAPGSYTFAVHAEGFAPQRRSLQLEAGENARLDLTLAG